MLWLTLFLHKHQSASVPHISGRCTEQQATTKNYPEWFFTLLTKQHLCLTATTIPPHRRPREWNGGHATSFFLWAFFSSSSDYKLLMKHGKSKQLGRTFLYTHKGNSMNMHLLGGVFFSLLIDLEGQRWMDEWHFGQNDLVQVEESIKHEKQRKIQGQATPTLVVIVA